MRKLLLWLVMVAVMIAAILGGTAAFLYSRTGTDALPQEAVTFGEQTLEPNGWSWVIPVLGDKVNKTYESPTNLTVQKLGTFRSSSCPTGSPLPSFRSPRPTARSGPAHWPTAIPIPIHKTETIRSS